MKIQVNSIEGKTSNKGAKQNKLYTVIDRKNNWYDAIDEKGSKFSIWDCNGDWSKIGIMRDGHTLRVSYTTEFKVIEE